MIVIFDFITLIFLTAKYSYIIRVTFHLSNLNRSNFVNDVEVIYTLTSYHDDKFNEYLIFYEKLGCNLRT